LYLSHGKVLADGPPDEVIPIYEKDILGGRSALDTPRWAQQKLESDPARRPVNISDMQILDEAGRPRAVFDFGERVRVRIRYELTQTINDLNFVVALNRSDGVACCNYSSILDGFKVPSNSGEGEFEVLMPELKLVADLYSIHVVVWDQKFQQLYGAQIGGSFHVRHDLFSTHFGVFHEPAEWSCSKSEDEESQAMPSIKLESD
jgi:lipopolysaccharide transport system ATP-binding protein